MVGREVGNTGLIGYDRQMDRHSFRALIAAVVLAITAVVVGRYFAGHPAVRHQLAQTSLATLALIVILYAATIATLALINRATLRLCNIHPDRQEVMLLTAYTAVINFFGPLQSGPAVRAVYLKKKYQLDLKKYALATIVYYGFFALFSGLFLLSGWLRWLLVPLTAAGLIVAWQVLRHTGLRQRLASLQLQHWYSLALATFLQVSLLVALYYVELHSVFPSVSLGQAITYTGAANFALFVSVTPGAIGFRESFLVFSQHLHHLSSTTIVSANIIDRGMYVLVLLCLTVLIFGTHASQRIKAVTTKS